MPSTAGLHILVRRTQPDYGEWLEMLEARRSLLQPYLDSFTLAELGAIECLAADSHHRSLRFDNPEVTGDGRFSLKTQGIFRRPTSGITRYQPKGNHPDPSWSGGSMFIWGLTRTGTWILANVQFQNTPGYKNRGAERAFTVDIKEATPARIAEQTRSTAKEIWEDLGDAVKKWRAGRQRLLSQAEEIAHQIEMEERALSLIQE